MQRTQADSATFLTRQDHTNEDTSVTETDRIKDEDDHKT